MAKALMLVRHPPQSWLSLLTQPEDRSTLLRESVTAAGATLEAMDFLVGEYDSCVTLSAPDDATLAGATLALTAVGGFSDVKVLTMIDPDKIPAMLGAGGAGVALVRRKMPGAIAH